VAERLAASQRSGDGSGDAALVRTMRTRTNGNLRPHQSGAEVTALQTLARPTNAPTGAKRLECGVFTAAFVPTTRYLTNQNFVRPKAAWCFAPRRTPKPRGMSHRHFEIGLQFYLNRSSN